MPTFTLKKIAERLVRACDEAYGREIMSKKISDLNLFDLCEVLKRIYSDEQKGGLINEAPDEDACGSRNLGEKPSSTSGWDTSGIIGVRDFLYGTKLRELSQTEKGMRTRVFRAIMRCAHLVSFPSIESYDPSRTQGGAFEIVNLEQTEGGYLLPLGSGSDVCLDLHNFSKNWLLHLRGVGEDSVKTVEKIMEQSGYKMRL